MYIPDQMHQDQYTTEDCIVQRSTSNTVLHKIFCWGGGGGGHLYVEHTNAQLVMLLELNLPSRGPQL